MPAPTSTRLLVLFSPQLAAMQSSTFCMPPHASVPYRPSIPSPPPSLFCNFSQAYEGHTADIPNIMHS